MNLLLCFILTWLLVILRIFPSDDDPVGALDRIGIFLIAGLLAASIWTVPTMLYLWLNWEGN